MKHGPEDVIDVVVEIPKGSRNKYEYEHATGVIRLDRRLLTAMTYPADYGFVPDSLGEDGDPLDAMVLLDDPTFPGCWVESRPIGVFWMRDEKGPDAKIICIPSHDPIRADVTDITQLPEMFLSEIEHFFDVYKILEKKKTAVLGFDGRDVAWKEIDAALKRYKDTPAH
jgi:inorganic pyrophosphatase